MPNDITFLAGNTDIAFDTIIQDDNIFEMDETFGHTLLIIPSSRAISIVNGTTTVVILDNDRKCKIQDENLYIHVFTAIEINFNQPTYSVDEDNGVVEIQLIFSNPSSIDMTIDINSEEINATSKFKINSFENLLINIFHYY